jgi:hypothetical protein
LVIIRKLRESLTPDQKEKEGMEDLNRDRGPGYLISRREKFEGPGIKYGRVQTNFEEG